MKKLAAIIFLLFAGFAVKGQATGVLDYIESGVTLRMSAPILPDGHRKFMMGIQTNDVYECANFPIEYDARLEGSKLIIRLKGVRRAEPCETGMAPSRANIDLTQLTEGKYKVRVVINRQIFKAKMEINADYIDFEILKEDPSLFRIYNGRLNMIPEGTIWGKCVYNAANLKEDAKRFMAELQKAGCTLTQIPAGNYSEFYLHQPGITEQKVIQGDRYEYPFVFAYKGDILVLSEIMNGFRETLQITLKDLNGKVVQNFE